MSKMCILDFFLQYEILQCSTNGNACNWHWYTCNLCHNIELSAECFKLVFNLILFFICSQMSKMRGNKSKEYENMSVWFFLLLLLSQMNINTTKINTTKDGL